MNNAAFRSEPGIPLTIRDYRLVGVVIGAVHLVLLILDGFRDSGFFRADRAQQRFGNMMALIDAYRSGGDAVSTLVAQGNIGDYGLHALFYAVGGHLAVTIFQTLLAVPSVLCVVYIAYRVFGLRKLAITSGLVYGLLPQSLAFPHQLLSEALSNPLAIFGTAAFLRALNRHRSLRSWILSGLFLGLAAMARPALILLPLIAALLLLLLARRPGRIAAAIPVVCCGLLPFVAWGSFMLMHTGKFGYGDSHQDLGINFSQSAAKVLLMHGISEAGGAPPAWLPERLSLSSYLELMKQYPAGFANLYFKNTVVLISDSGIGRLYVDLLGFGAEARLKLQDPETGWRAQLTNNGPLAMIEYGMRVAPGTIIAGILGGLGFAVVNFGLLVAYVFLLKPGSALYDSARPIVQRWGIAFLLVLPFYVIATSQVVAYAPSRLRSQAEFAWAILACFGWAVAIAWFSDRRQRALGNKDGQLVIE